MKSRPTVKVILYPLLYLCTILLVASSVLLSKHLVSNVFFFTMRLIIIVFASTLLLKYTLYMLISPWFEFVMARRRKQLRNTTAYTQLASLRSVSLSLVPLLIKPLLSLALLRSARRKSVPQRLASLRLGSMSGWLCRHRFHSQHCV